MEFAQQGPLFQVQYYLNELSLHITKINDIIIQMNNYINQINNSQLFIDINNQKNQMNNFMMNNPMNFNMNMNMNMNMNNNLFPNMNKQDDFNEIIHKDNLINIQFFYHEMLSANIQFANRTLTINDLLNLYLKKINKRELVNNYNNNFFFIIMEN